MFQDLPSQAQMEKINWGDMVMTAGIFLLCIASAGFLLYGFFNASPETQQLILLINAEQQQE